MSDVLVTDRDREMADEWLRPPAVRALVRADMERNE